MTALWMGALAGVVSGMGMGGGAVLIPLLTLVAGAAQKEAQAVNLLAYLPAAAVALYVHYKNGRVNFQSAKHMLILGFPGAIAGVLLALWLPSEWLRRVFGVFLCLLSALSATKDWKRKKQSAAAYTEKKTGGHRHESDI